MFQLPPHRQDVINARCVWLYLSNVTEVHRGSRENWRWENPKHRKHPSVKHHRCQLCVLIVFYWIFQVRISGLDSCCSSRFPTGETPTGLNTTLHLPKTSERQRGAVTGRVLRRREHRVSEGRQRLDLSLNKIHDVNKVTHRRRIKKPGLLDGSFIEQRQHCKRLFLLLIKPILKRSN